MEAGLDALIGMDVSLGPALQVRGLGKRENHLGQEGLGVLFPIFNGTKAVGYYESYMEDIPDS